MDSVAPSYSANYSSPSQNYQCQQPSGFSALPQLSQAVPGGFPMAPVTGQMPSTATPSGNQSSQNQMMQPITDLNQAFPVTAESLQYLNGFLRTQIGRKVRVEFLIGTSTMTDRIGVLIGVGANYILLNEIETDDILACDFYNIKFIRFYY